MAVGYDFSDRLLTGQAVTTVPVIQESRWMGWDLNNDIVARLSVLAGAAGAGDSLIVVLQHSLDHVIWHTLLTFTTILGNGSFPASEVKNANKGTGVSWGPWIRAVSTPAGGTAVFTVTDLRIIGS